MLKQIELQAARWKMAARERVLAVAAAVVAPIAPPAPPTVSFTPPIATPGEATLIAPVKADPTPVAADFGVSRIDAWRRRRAEATPPQAAPQPDMVRAAMPVPAPTLPAAAAAVAAPALPPQAVIAQTPAPAGQTLNRMARWRDKFRSLVQGAGADEFEPNLAAT
jgi:hypothetical protein